MAQSIGEIEATLKLKDELTGQLRLATREVEKAGIKLDELDRTGSKGLDNVARAATGGSDALSMMARNAGALVGAGVATALVGIATSAIKSADALVDMNAKTGLSIDFLQRAGYVARQSGSNLDSFSDAVFKLGVNVAKGSKTTVEALEQIGLSLKAVQGLRPEALFDLVAPKLAAIEDINKRNAAMVALFGRNVADNIPAIVENYKKLAAEAPVASEAQVRSLAAAADAWDRLKDRVSASATSILGNFALIVEGATKSKAAAANAVAGFLGGSMAGFDTLALMGEFGVPKQRKDIALSTESATKAETDYVKALAETQKVLAGLSPETRRQIDAAMKLGASTKDLEERFGLADGALRVYTAGVKANTAAHKAASKEVTEHRKQLDRLITSLSGSGLQQELSQMEEAVAELFLSGGTISQSQLPKLIKQIEDWRAAGLKIPPILANIAAQQKRLTDAQGDAVAFMNALASGQREWEEADRHFQSFVGSVEDGIAHLRQLGTGITPADLDRLRKASIDSAKAANEVWKGFGADISDTILRSLEGGGNPLEAIGALIGNRIGKWFVKEFGSSITGLLGDTVGGFINKIIPGLGSLLGAAFGKLGSLFSNIFGEGEGRKMVVAFADSLGGFDALHERLHILGDQAGEALWIGLTQGVKKGDKKAAQAAIDRINKALKDTEEAMARAGLSADDLGDGLANMSKRAKQLESDLKLLTASGFSLRQITTGNKDALNDLIRAALDTGQKIPAALEPMLIALATSGELSDDLRRRLLGLPDAVDWKQMEADMEKFGISAAAAGTRFEQAKIDDTAADIVAVWGRWEKAGANMSLVAEGLSDEVSELVRKALDMGLTLPAGMQPIIQAMYEAGLLTDDAGKKIEDISGLTFAPTLEESLGDLVGAIRDLIDILTKDLPDAAAEGAQGVEDAFNNIKFPKLFGREFGGGSSGGSGDSGEQNAPGLASGGYVPARPGGSLFRLGEGGEGEWVIPDSLMGGRGGSAPIVIHNHTYLDGRQISENVTMHQNAFMQDLGVTRVQ